MYPKKIIPVKNKEAPIPSLSHHLHDHIAFPRPIEFYGKNTLQRAQDGLPALDEQRLACAEENLLAVRMTIRSTIRFDAASKLEKIMGILIIHRNHAVKNPHKILDKKRFIVVYRNAHGGMRSEDDYLALPHPGAIHDFSNPVRDVDKLNLRLRLEYHPLSMYFHMYVY